MSVKSFPGTVAVASSAGVASSAVLRVPPDRPLRSQVVRTRVVPAANEHPYHPSRAARSPRSEPTFTIVLPAHDLASPVAHVHLSGALAFQYMVGVQLAIGQSDGEIPRIVIATRRLGPPRG